MPIRKYKNIVPANISFIYRIQEQDSHCGPINVVYCIGRGRGKIRNHYLLFISLSVLEYKKKVTPKIPIEFIFCISSCLRKSSCKINYHRYVNVKQISGFDEVTLLATVDQNRPQTSLNLTYPSFFCFITIEKPI